MNKRVAVGFIVIAVSLLTTSAYSQSMTLRADIPFAFTANGVGMQPGMYTLRSQDDVILWSSANGSSFTLAATRASSKQYRSCLIFRVYGDHYVLAQIWAGNHGREFRQPKPEKQLARGEKPKEVAILLYPVR